MMLPNEVQYVLQAHVETIHGRSSLDVALRWIAEATPFDVYSID